MKIERLNENQIRCTLDRADLNEHQVKLTELAYGSAKAQALFRDICQQASDTVGFEIGELPLMVEAIPVNTDCLVLIVTKVEDPEEFDTRFSNFTKPYLEEDDADDSDIEWDEADTAENQVNELPEEVIRQYSIFKDLLEAILKTQSDGDSGKQSGDFQPLSEIAKRVGDAAGNKAKKKPVDSFTLFAFRSMEDVIQAANALAGRYQGKNILYKNPTEEGYFLLMHSLPHEAEEFKLMARSICEYGTNLHAAYTTQFHMQEHYPVILKDNALQTLASL